MQNYEKIYHLMFNAATDALIHIENHHYTDAKKVLVDAQCRAEDEYISYTAQPDIITLNLQRADFPDNQEKHRQRQNRW